MAMIRLGPLFLALALCICARPAMAQDPRDQFTGTWYSFDPQQSSNPKHPCTVILTAERHSQGQFRASSRYCAGALAALALWTVKDGQIHLMDPMQSRVLARVGGNQHRLTGQSPDTFLILERPSQTGKTAQITAAIRTYRCLFLGYGAACASAADTRIPKAASTAQATITSLVDLNVRAQPRADAPPVGVLPVGAEIKTTTCLAASDGLWCGALFGERMGWFARTALRQDTWPVLTFRFSPNAASP